MEGNGLPFPLSRELPEALGPKGKLPQGRPCEELRAPSYPVGGAELSLEPSKMEVLEGIRISRVLHKQDRTWGLSFWVSPLRASRLPVLWAATDEASGTGALG